MTPELETRIRLALSQGRSQREVARELGTSQSAVSRVSRGVAWRVMRAKRVETKVLTDSQKRRIDSWLTGRETVLACCLDFIKRATEVEGSERDPDMVRAINGSLKIIVDADCQRVIVSTGRTDAGRDTVGSAPTASGGRSETPADRTYDA